MSSWTEVILCATYKDEPISLARRYVYTSKIDASPQIDELHSAIIRKVVILGQATGCSLLLGFNGTRRDGSNAQTRPRWNSRCFGQYSAVPFIPIV